MISKQPVPGILMIAKRGYMTLYYPDWQGLGERIIGWTLIMNDDGTPSDQWASVHYGTPEQALKIFITPEWRECLEAARRVC